MRYKPRRDIPRAVRELKSLSPTEICKWIRNHRTRVNKKTGKREQVIRKPSSITNFYRRNPDIKKQLQREIEDVSKPDAVMSETDLANGSFLKIPCIEKWVLQLRGRGAKDKAINMFLGHLKYICMGKLPNPRKRRKEGKPSIILEDWGLKHPASLTLKDCLKYNSAMIENEVDTRNYRLAMRNFLKSRNIEGCDTISGKLEKEKGQYAHLYTNKTNEIFAWLKDFNYEVYLISKFAFKCGGVRKTASLNAEAQYVDVENKTIILFEKSNRNAPKRKVIKEIPDDLFEELLPRIKVGGKLFNISDKDLCKILRACYKAVIPELEPNIPMPFHFWRHQFAQHMLRATDWNYALVALYGDWKVQTLEDYYGAMDKREVRGFAREKLAEI